MYLEKIKSKGNTYAYLKKYDNGVTYSNDKRVTLHRFGRKEKALENMYKWRNGEKPLPQELELIGCKNTDVEKWINRLEVW